MKHFLYRLMLINAIWSLVFQPFTIYAGGITPDGSTNTQVIAAPNGTPIVNISAPSSGGVSHNKFIDYNVGKDNLILNNSNVNGHSSNLGGILPGNSNLNNGHAGVILNEVTSSNRSILEGYTEISGNSAALIIANPNGITCNGCGFLNTDRTSLVTGRPEFDEYGIKGFNLSPDSYIEINGRGQHNLGFDGGASAADIVSRAVKINGNIFSDKDVNVLTGNNHYSYRDNRVSSDLTYTEGVAVDSTAFGGIYAGRIRIVGTEKGFGVNVNNLMGLKNGMVADADEITITADGKVVMAGNQLTSNIVLNSGETDIKGNLSGQTGLNISSSGVINNEGIIASEKDINVSAITLNNSGNVLSNSCINVSADSLVNSSNIQSNGKMHLNAANIYNYKDISARDSLILSGHNLHNRGIIESGDILGTSLYELINYKSAVIVSNGDMDLGVNHNLINFKAKIQSGGSLSIHGSDGYLDTAGYNPGINRNYGLYGENVCVLGLCYRGPYSEGVRYSGMNINDIANYYRPNNPAESNTSKKYDYVASPDRNYSVQNIGGTISSVSGMEIRTTTLENLAIEKVKDGHRLYSSHRRHRGFSNKNNGGDPVPENINWVTSNLTIDHNYMGTISSGGDMVLDARNITNHSGMIAAGMNLSIYSDNLNNSRTSYKVENIFVGYHKSRKRGCKYCNKRKSIRTRRSYDTTLYSDTGGVIAANRNLGISSETVKIDDMLSGKDYSDGVDFDKSKMDLSKGSNNSSITFDLAAIGVDYSFNKPDSTYLFETNRRFTDKNTFFGSDYFISTTGYNPDVKRIGDAHFEHEYIQSQILRQTQRPFISGFSGSTEQMKYLWANSVSVQKAGQLEIGKTPTAEQLAKIDKDFIWYVKRSVNGIDVLVPTLFLTDANKKHTGQSSIFLAGNSLNIRSNNISGSGTIESGGDMSIASVNVDLYSDKAFSDTAIKAGGNIDIKADGIFAIKGVDITAVKSFSLDAGDIDIAGISHTTRDVYHEDGYVVDKIKTEHFGSNLIAANIQLKSKTDITLTGSELNATKNIGIIAGGNVNMLTGVESESISKSKSSDSMFSSSTTTINQGYIKYIGNKISSGGGDITMIAGGDLHSVSTDFKSGGSTNLISGKVVETENGKTVLKDSGIDGSVNLYEAKNESWYNKETVTSGFGGSVFGNNSKKTTNIKDMQAQVTKIEADSSINISSAKDINIRGGELSAGKDILLDAANNINLLAAQNTHEFSEISSKGNDLSSEVKVHQTLDVTNVGTSIKAGNVVMVAGKDVYGEGTKLASQADVNIYGGYKLTDDARLIESGEKGNVGFYDVQDEHYEYKMTKKTNITDGLKNLAKSLVNPQLLLPGKGGIVSFNDGKLQAKVKIGSQTMHSEETLSTTAVGSAITALNDINILSAHDVSIRGSDVNAVNDINVTAANDINITAAKNTQTQTVTDEKTDLYATATAGNKYIDVYNAGRDAHDAAKAVDEARENLHLMEKLHREGKSTLQAVDDAKTNLAFATANLASATVAGASSVSSAGSYTGSAYGTGFYGNVGLQADTSSDKAENSNIFYSGSSVNAGQNVNFTAGGNMIQSGSHVITKKGDVAYNIKNNLYLDAVGNSSSSSHTSKSGSVSVSVGLDSVSGSANVSVGSNRSSYTLYANSSTAAENGKITFNVGGDMAGVGYNGKAKDIKADVKGNLLLTSLQNSGSSSSTSSSYGVSGGTGSAGGSLGISSGNGSYQDTVVSSLIGTESVKINAGGKLGLSGSIIAHITNDGRDGGNLNIKAGSIEVTHLEDHNTNRQSGFNAGTNVGGIANDGAYPSGSTSIGLNRSGHEKEGMTYATIGSGNIAVADGGSLSELNRDIDNIKVTTKDVITGALDVNLSVDNRLFTQSGRDSIAEDFLYMPENLNIAKNGILYDLHDLKEYVSGKDDNEDTKNSDAYAGRTYQVYDEKDLNRAKEKLKNGEQLDKSESDAIEIYNFNIRYGLTPEVEVAKDYTSVEEGLIAQEKARAVIDKVNKGKDLTREEQEILNYYHAYNMEIKGLNDAYKAQAAKVSGFFEDIIDNGKNILHYAKVCNNGSQNACGTMLEETGKLLAKKIGYDKLDVEPFSKHAKGYYHDGKDLDNPDKMVLYAMYTQKGIRGNPIVRYNKNLLTSNDNPASGVAYLVGHEIGGHHYHNMIIKYDLNIEGVNENVLNYLNKSYDISVKAGNRMEYYKYYENSPHELLADETGNAAQSVFERKFFKY